MKSEKSDDPIIVEGKKRSMIDKDGKPVTLFGLPVIVDPDFDDKGFAESIQFVPFESIL